MLQCRRGEADTKEVELPASTDTSDLHLTESRAQVAVSPFETVEHPKTPESPETPESLDSRSTADRRAAERREGPRRDREVREENEKRNYGRIGTLCAALAATIGVWALAFAPVVAQSTPCSDSLGGEMLHRREIHPVWIAAVVLCVLAIALPSRPRRSYLSVGLVGLTAGLLVAAAIRVATWRTGICFT